MRNRLGVALAVLMLTLMACTAGIPPTQFVIEVTVVHTVVITPTSENDANVAETPVPTVTSTDMPTRTPAPSPTALPQGYPTPVVGQVYVAEQAFQRGRMIWLEPVKQIWVLTSDENENHVWLVYNDTWEEGMPEADPNLQPPEPGLQQPIRGFGQLWRENPDVFQLLGWAVDPEFGFVSRYEFHHGGRIDTTGSYIQEPGYHILEAYNGDILRIDETTRTWEKIGDSSP